MKPQVHWRGDHSNLLNVIEVSKGDVLCMNSKTSYEPIDSLSIIGEFTSRGTISVIIFLITTVMINFM